MTPPASSDSTNNTSAGPSATGVAAGRRVSERIGGIAESATLAVDAKAKALKAAGRPVIGFGAGEPDFPTPDYIVEAAVEACRDPRNHRYTPAGGLPELKQAIVDKTLRDSGYAIEPAQVLVTNGGKQAIYEAFATILDPGDEVILPAPYWTTYPEAIRLAGGVPVEVLADESQGYQVTVEQLEAARTDRTKALLFCSPSNPTGAVATPEEVEAIGRWLLDNGLWVVTDEIYEHLTYGDTKTSSLPVAAARPGGPVHRRERRRQDLRHDRLAGRLADRPQGRRQGRHQPAVARHVERQQRRPARRHRRSVRGPVRGRRDARGLRPAPPDHRADAQRDPGVECPEPTGAFYAYPSVKGVLGREIAGRTPTTSAELAEVILDEVEVAVVPGEAFGAPGYLRMSYALGDDDLAEGVGRIQKLLG